MNSRPAGDSKPAPPPCPACKGTGLNDDRTRFCSSCLGSGKKEKRRYGWQ